MIQVYDNLDTALKAFAVETQDVLRDEKRHRFFVPDHESKYKSRHSGKRSRQSKKGDKK